MVRARIVGTGSYAPEKVLTNDDLSKILDTSDEWIRSRTGIGARHVAAVDENTSDMAVEAGMRALEMAGKSPADVDMIIVGTISPDMPMPAAAAFLQAKLGVSGAASFDVSAACAGSLYALSIADKFIRCGDAKCVLVVGVELLTRLIDWEDRNTAVLFGDAAGAMVLVPEQDEAKGVLTTQLHTDGSQAEILCIPGGGSRHPVNEETLAERLQYVRMNGREVFKFATRALTEVSREALKAADCNVADLDWLVPHQANTRILDYVADKLELPQSKIITNIVDYGNTSSASVPVTLDDGVRGGKIKEGDLVMMIAIGAGMSWGSALCRW